jgi:hypothetical protein
LLGNSGNQGTLFLDAIVGQTWDASNPLLKRIVQQQYVPRFPVVESLFGQQWDVRVIHHHHHHHHQMALQPNSGLGLPLWGFITVTLLQGWIVSPAPNPQPGGPGLRIYDPRRQGGPAVTPGTGYPF